MKENLSNTEVTQEELKAFTEFIRVIKTLRHPKDGCPWDLKQTPESMRSSIIEEAYECVEAINSKDNEHVKEELGDVLLVAFMIIYINQQSGNFSIEETLSEITEKLVRRHPHVFKDTSANLNPDQVIEQWDDIKENVEGRRKKDSALDGVKEFLPPLEQAYKIQKKAAKTGFDWKNVLDIFEKIDEEKNELIEAIYSGDKEEIENEIGDMLFSVVNVSRFMKIKPQLAMMRTIHKFRNRFHYIEAELKKQDKKLEECSLEELDEIWNRAKDKL